MKDDDEKIEVGVATIKYIEEPVYLSVAQANIIADKTHDPEQNMAMCRVGKYLFKPADVAVIEFKLKEWYDLPSYCLKEVQNASKRLN